MDPAAADLDIDAVVASAAKMAAGIAAVAEHCEGKPGVAADLDPAAMTELEAQGTDAVAFRAAYREAYKEASATVAASSKDELDKQCAELEEFKRMGEAMQQSQGAQDSP